MVSFTKLRFPGDLIVKFVVSLVVLAIIGWFAIEWTYNRIYVPEGYSLLLRYKGPPLPIPGLGMRPEAETGRFAKVDANSAPLELGILEEMVGPGRHFYCPLWWERTLVKDEVVEPGEVAIVTSKMGKELPETEYLVEGDLGKTEYKGILRRAFGPGRYRVNSYAYDFKKGPEVTFQSGNQEKKAGWVNIPTGYVGVVTNLADNPLAQAEVGIQDNVLPPGLYPINEKEQQVDIVNIGYRETSIIANQQTDGSSEPKLDLSGEPLIAEDGSGIEFPSNDGFPIRMDFTAIWGVMPDQASEVIRKFGNVDAVETKVVVPQIESICRNMGSKLGAVELLVGETRQQFQEETSTTFRDILDEKGITVLNGLVRHIHIPQEVRMPIQEANIADELKLTREQEQLTAETEGSLREAEEKVKLATQEIKVQTEKLVAQKMAEGQKTAEETKAETKKLIAAIDKQTAEIEAQATVMLGEAEASAQKMSEEAKADKFGLAVEAFGSGQAYNQWVFATGLPDDIELNLLYAGDGTFWTDLKGFSDVMLGRQVKQSQAQQPAQRRPAVSPSGTKADTRPR